MDQNIKIIDGKRLAERRTKVLRNKVTKLPVMPKVVSIIVGDDPASLLYTEIKKRKAEELGITFTPLYFSAGTLWEEVSSSIKKANLDREVIGILIQLPLPKEFLGNYQQEELLEKIKPEKDIDGLTKNSPFLPATVRAVLSILEDEEINVSGEKVVVLGRSPWLGKPLAEELRKRGAEVMVGHSQTIDLKQITQDAKVLISAVGKPKLVTGDMISEGVVVIDVGTNQLGNKIVGDVDFETVLPKASKITPVPGGVGPMTVVSLMENVVKLLYGFHG